MLGFCKSLVLNEWDWSKCIWQMSGPVSAPGLDLDSEMFAFGLVFECAA